MDTGCSAEYGGLYITTTRKRIAPTLTNHSETSNDDFSAESTLTTSIPSLINSTVPPPMRFVRGQWQRDLYPGGLSSLKTAESLAVNQVSQIVNISPFTSHARSTNAADLFLNDLADDI